MPTPPVRITGSTYKSEVRMDGSIPVTISGVEDGPIRFADSANLDAFDRLRISSPSIIFDSQFQYDDQVQIWDEVKTSGGTAQQPDLPNENSFRLQVSTTANSSVIRQTYQYFPYQPGRSQLILMTFVLGATNSNVDKYVGYGDGENGIFLHQRDDGVLTFTQRSKVTAAVVDTEVEQSFWNIDHFDGNGKSGVNLNPNYAQIMIIDLEWLGVGRVRCGFVVDGVIYYAHEFLNANKTTGTYMTTANLPLRYQITATGSAGATTEMKQICSMVASEGGAENIRGVEFSTDSGGITPIAVTTRRAILSIRPRTLFNSITNRKTIVLESIGLFVSSTSDIIFWELVYNGALGGTPSWANVNTSNSGVEKDIAGTTVTGGIVIKSGYLSSTAQAKFPFDSDTRSRLPISLDIAGTGQKTISLVATSFAGSSDVHGTIRWREI